MRAPDTPVRLDPAQVAEAATLMGRAAASDPLLQHCLPDASQRPIQLASFMGTVLRICLAKGAVWTTPGQMTGVASWLAPDHPTISQEDWDAFGWEAVQTAWGVGAIGRFQEFRADLGELSVTLPQEPHWYLAWVCVAPDAQGQGIGRTLITAGLARADATGLACHLRTMAARTIPLYENLGFVVAHETLLPRSGIQLWYMVRPPQA